VYGIAPGNFGNYIRAPAGTLQKMDAGDLPAEMASIPVSYMTAVYAFMRLARLCEGETVLIQSATGGLGMAALRIARHLGAEIFATVGTSEKAKLLVDEFGISEDHIFSSRELSAIPKLMDATGGKGIDVILCSAGGEQMHETWRCIAPMGRFIDVGRTDVIDHGKLALEVFKRNATFSSFDLGLLFQQNLPFCSRYVPFPMG
jgi:NADPH:quinone reductase-like Zn-dependent oxidoreductase